MSHCRRILVNTQGWVPDGAQDKYLGLLKWAPIQSRSRRKQGWHVVHHCTPWCAQNWFLITPCPHPLILPQEASLPSFSFSPFSKICSQNEMERGGMFFSYIISNNNNNLKLLLNELITYWMPSLDLGIKKAIKSFGPWLIITLVWY